MKAVKPILIEAEALDIPIIEFGATQDEYETLPAFVSNDQSFKVTCRFKLTWRERLEVLFGGNLWLQQLTFGRAFQPVKLWTKEPNITDCL